MKLALLYAANLAAPSLVRRSEKDELQRLGTLCGGDQRLKIISEPSLSQLLTLYLEETHKLLDE
jgi:hypothetical protein